MPTPMTTDLTTAVNESKTPLPYNASGVTADDVIKNSPQPQSIAAFRARGGISNTVNQMRNNAIQEQREAAVKAGYEKLLQGNTRAADAVYQAYSAKIKGAGGNPEDWIPPKDLFYDPQTGYFLPHKYYEAVYVGSKKFQEDKLAKDKLAKEQAEKDAKIASNKQFGQMISENPSITKQDAMGKALSQGTVTTEMMTAAGAMNDSTKATNSAKKLDFEWAKLNRQKNSDRLREMQILLSQSQNRNESIRRAGEKIADVQKDLREIQQRRKELATLYNKAQRGESVYMKIDGADIKVSSEDLNEMVRNAEVLEIESKATIDDLKAMQKTNILSPVRTNVQAGAENITDDYGDKAPSPTPVTQPKPVIKPSLSVSPKPLNAASSPAPTNDPLGIR
jgi:hypothetical protein